MYGTRWISSRAGSVGYRAARFALVCLIAAPLACGGGGGTAPVTAERLIPDLPEGIAATPLVVVAGMQQLDPSEVPAPDLDYERAGLQVPETVYELTAPAGTPFEFDVVSQGAALSGPVRVHVAHLADGEDQPDPGPGTILAGGVVLSGPGQLFDDVARAGDELHVVVHERRDLRSISIGIVDVPEGQRPTFIGIRGSPFAPAPPPQLREGLTGAVPEPNAAHRHQLRLLRLR